MIPDVAGDPSPAAESTQSCKGLHTLCYHTRTFEHPQTYNPQVKLFGGYTRWSADLPAPTDTAPARSLLSTLGTAVRSAASGPAPGPVHLNCQFREPLAPLQADWSRACLQVGGQIQTFLVGREAEAACLGWVSGASGQGTAFVRAA